MAASLATHYAPLSNRDLQVVQGQRPIVEIRDELNRPLLQLLVLRRMHEKPAMAAIILEFTKTELGKLCAKLEKEFPTATEPRKEQLALEHAWICEFTRDLGKLDVADPPPWQFTYVDDQEEPMRRLLAFLGRV